MKLVKLKYTFKDSIFAYFYIVIFISIFRARFKFPCVWPNNAFNATPCGDKLCLKIFAVLTVVVYLQSGRVFACMCILELLFMSKILTTKNLNKKKRWWNVFKKQLQHIPGDVLYPSNPSKTHKNRHCRSLHSLKIQ